MAAGSARREWAAGWPLILTCVVGMSAPTLGHYTLGQFMAPMEHALGWSRTQASAGMSLSMLISMVIAPLVGRATDIVNVRNLALVGLVLTGCMYASFSFATASTGLWVALWLMHAACAGLISPVVWISVIPARFTVSRSLAVAVALSGTSLSVALAPTLAQSLINAYAWREAFRLLALIWFGVALLLTLCFFVDRRDHRAARASGAEAKAAGRTVSVSSLVASPTFLKLALAVFAVFVIDAAYLVHLAPALVDKGFAPLAAAKLVGVSGVAAIAGKLVAGWLFDRMPFEAVSTSVMIMLAVACALFVPFGGSTAGAVAVCVALGLTIGAMFTVIACVTRQLFAADAFGLVFGVLTSVMALASAAGPMLGSTVHDRFGSYDGIYWAGVVVAGVSALLLATLKPRGAAAAEAAAGAK